uniref:Glycosyltransferase n=2 Tax=Avena strigosa TaxID=38783 RepID=A0A3S5HT27_9POAL|nr:UGT85F24 [Avena strigosa]
MGSMEQKKPHAVCVPFPAQGHITPMLKVAKLLHARGFHVTFVLTDYNYSRLLRSRGAAAFHGCPGFDFASIPDGLPPSDAEATQDIPALCRSTMTTCLPHVSALLATLNGPASAVPPVTCLLCDACMSFAYDAAKEIGLPCAGLWTASGCGFMAYNYYKNLVEQGLVPLKDEAQRTDGYLDTVVHGVPGVCDGFQLRDFPDFIRTTDSDDIMLNFLIRETARAASLPDAVIINSFDDLEQRELDAMRAILPPVCALGPLLLHVRRLVPEGSPLDVAVQSNLWKEQDGLLEWLDSHPPRSVVYVNYGSITVMTNEQMLEFAWGLANSGYPFLWNVRPDLVKGDAAVLPPEFSAAIEGRGLLTTWCPQEKVIVQDAVGVFLTHSGWNSTLESLCAGVPMLSWPFFAEQQTNCRYKRTEWGVGMEIGGEVRRAEVAAKIQEAMEGEKGKEMRRRAAEWKEKAARATLPGGAAEANLDKLIDVLHGKTGQAVNASTGRN